VPVICTGANDTFLHMTDFMRQDLEAGELTWRR
jgi:hypothetical protein